MLRSYQPAFFAAALLCSGLSAWADTAYTALQVVGKKFGTASLSRVLEVHGRFGEPEPTQWNVLLEDDRARNGVREVEVQKGKITGDRSPSYRESSGPMDFNQLNLDSEGVFTIVNQETQKANVTFDRVDYTLTAGARGGAPVWHLELWQGTNGQVGQFDISADDGKILARSFDKVPNSRLSRRDPVREDDRAFIEDERDADVDVEVRRRYDDEDYYEPRSSGGGFAGKVERHFERRARQIKKFFSGGYFR